MVGFEPKRFIKQGISQELVCKSCHYILKTPMQCKVCKNKVCKSCLYAHHKSPCEDDKSNYIEANKFLRNKISDLNVRCKNFRVGCEHISIVANIEKHETSCPFAGKSCTHKSCDQVIPCSQLEDHKEVCDFKIVQCDSGCDKLMHAHEVDDHNCVSFLREQIKEQQKEKEELEKHLEESENDVNVVSEQYTDYKSKSGGIIEELKNKLLSIEADNDKMRKNHSEELKKMCTTSSTKMKIFQENSEQRLQAYLKNAQKEIEEFQQKLNDEYQTFSQKSKQLFTNYEIKARADFIDAALSQTNLDMTGSPKLRKHSTNNMSFNKANTSVTPTRKLDLNGSSKMSVTSFGQ